MPKQLASYILSDFTVCKHVMKFDVASNKIHKETSEVLFYAVVNLLHILCHGIRYTRKNS